MKKVLIFLGIMILLFVGLTALNNMKSNETVKNKETKTVANDVTVKDNPYGKDLLYPETVDQLDDENYQNLILPDELKKKLADKEDVTVYYYQPTCSHCLRTTPIVSQLSKDMGIDLVQFNLLEFDQGWDDFGIDQTPTIVQYKAGKETARIIGYNEKAVFQQWFTENSLTK